MASCSQSSSASSLLSVLTTRNKVEEADDSASIVSVSSSKGGGGRRRKNAPAEEDLIPLGGGGFRSLFLSSSSPSPVEDKEGEEEDNNTKENEELKMMERRRRLAKTTASIPDGVKGKGAKLMACMLCSLIKSYEDFRREGCDNCEPILRLKGKQGALPLYTSENFEGMIALMDPKDSWVAKYQRLKGLKKGIYAVSVRGKIGEDIHQILLEEDIYYKSRDKALNRHATGVMLEEEEDIKKARASRIIRIKKERAVGNSGQTVTGSSAHGNITGKSQNASSTGVEAFTDSEEDSSEEEEEELVDLVTTDDSPPPARKRVPSLTIVRGPMEGIGADLADPTVYEKEKPAGVFLQKKEVSFDEFSDDEN